MRRQMRLYGATLLLLMSVLSVRPASAGPEAPEVLPFIEDDFQAALSEARTKNLPIFVETWAPW